MYHPWNIREAVLQWVWYDLVLSCLGTYVRVNYSRVWYGFTLRTQRQKVTDAARNTLSYAPHLLNPISSEHRDEMPLYVDMNENTEAEGDRCCKVHLYHTTHTPWNPNSFFGTSWLNATVCWYEWEHRGSRWQMQQGRPLECILWNSAVTECQKVISTLCFWYGWVLSLPQETGEDGIRWILVARRVSAFSSHTSCHG